MFDYRCAVELPLKNSSDLLLYVLHLRVIYMKEVMYFEYIQLHNILCIHITLSCRWSSQSRLHRSSLSTSFVYCL